MPSDLKGLLAFAASKPKGPVDLDLLWRRGRRRRSRRLAAAATGLSVMGGAAVAAWVTSFGPMSMGPASRGDFSCTANDLRVSVVRWQPNGLVLTAVIIVTNDRQRACLLRPPTVDLLSSNGQPLMSGTGGASTPVPVEAQASQPLELQPGQSGQAILRWGGSYCGPPTKRVRLRLTFDRAALETTIDGGTLPCRQSAYYDTGQSSAAVSGFSLTTHASGHSLRQFGVDSECTRGSRTCRSTADDVPADRPSRET